MVLDLQLFEKLFNLKASDDTEISNLFNRKKYFYSYDTFSMYIIYAGLCGCIPIVRKIENMNKKDWLINYGPMGFSLTNEDNFPGIAYGIEDIPYAEKTIDQFTDFYYKCKKYEIKTVNNFINNVSTYFFPKEYLKDEK